MHTVKIILCNAIDSYFCLYVINGYVTLDLKILKVFFLTICIIGKEDWCDIDIDCYSQCLKAFSLLAGVEFSALVQVFPEFYWKMTFDPLVQVQ